MGWWKELKENLGWAKKEYDDWWEGTPGDSVKDKFENSINEAWDNKVDAYISILDSIANMDVIIDVTRINGDWQTLYFYYQQLNKLQIQLQHEEIGFDRNMLIIKVHNKLLTRRLSNENNEV